nr:MAG TPA: hypothetical protein [Caudoviricetes sp.]
MPRTYSFPSLSRPTTVKPFAVFPTTLDPEKLTNHFPFISLAWYEETAPSAVCICAKIVSRTQSPTLSGTFSISMN